MNLFFFLAACSSFSGVDKLDSKYWIQYGDPQGKIHAVEYFSLSCPKCFEFYRKEFPRIKEKYIDTGSVSWVFHPDPADLLTLQAMVCLETLAAEEKSLFFEVMMENLALLKGSEKRCKLMQTAMEVFQKPLPDLGKMEFLEHTEAFQNAFHFLTQEKPVTILPSIEIEGTFYKDYPSVEFIGQHIGEGSS